MKKTKLKYCKNCQRIYHEKRTIKKRIFKVIKFTFIIFILITSIFGSTALYNFISGGIYENPNLTISISSFYAFVLNNLIIPIQSNNELKEIALDLTKNCPDDYCKTKKIYDHLLTFEYEKGSNPENPLEIYKEKSGDCDELSYLFKSLLDQLNIKSVLQYEPKHAYLIIKLDKMNILADLTKGEWEEHKK